MELTEAVARAMYEKAKEKSHCYVGDYQSFGAAEPYTTIDGDVDFVALAKVAIATVHEAMKANLENL